MVVFAMAYETLEVPRDTVEESRTFILQRLNSL